MSALDSYVPRIVQITIDQRRESAKLYLGRSNPAFEILVIDSATTPTNVLLRKVWRERAGQRAIPLGVVMLHSSDRASLCGAAGEQPPVFLDLNRGQVERLCAEVLDAPDRHFALSLFGRLAESLPGKLPGVRNEGLLSAYELAVRAPQNTDRWQRCAKQSVQCLGKRGETLLRHLGFDLKRTDNVTSILTSRDKNVALAVLLEANETPEGANPRFSGVSPISYAMAKATAENLPWVVTVHGASIRVYPTRPGVGIARRGRSETFIEAHSALLPDEKAALLWLLFSADSLAPGGTLEALLEESARFAGTLAANLRERIYLNVVPLLAEGVVRAQRIRKPTASDLTLTYEATLLLLFRLLFIAYAEDKDLLPYRFNGLYQKRSLKSEAMELLLVVQSGRQFDEGAAYWRDMRDLFTAVDMGRPSWGVPRYNGGLFSSDPDISPAGALLATIEIPDKVLGPALASLLLIENDFATLGPVDFASLGVREFGTIYEGLLESEMSVAEQDLAIDRDGNFVPARGRAKVEVKTGQVYLHNRSGARKSTGSYFTKEFAVDHLLDRALEPALAEHLQRLDALDETEATASFFDFRVADISMGSGHFLIGAIDRIEVALSSYLARRPLAGVRKELAELRTAARSALGEIADQLGEIETDKVLRRQIARRCVYGVDLNPVSVHLARLAVWIHTFVPGLPLSFLDRNLVCGNSLIGVGTVEELKARFERTAEENELFVHSGLVLNAETLLKDATEPLLRLATISDATYEDIRRAQRAMQEAERATAAARAMCDIITAFPLMKAVPEGESQTAWEKRNKPLSGVRFDQWDKMKAEIVGSPAHKRATELLQSTPSFHFPIAFPEVFLRKRCGFDVLVGNPPWDKVRVEEHEFWARHFPGLRGMASAQRNQTLDNLRKTRPELQVKWEKERAESEAVRNVLRDKPGMNTGHPDLFRAFMVRNIEALARPGGRLGIVLPGDAFKIKGAASIRELAAQAFGEFHAQLLTNKGGWMFDDVHPQKLIALVTAETKEADATGTFHHSPEYHSLMAWRERTRETAVTDRNWMGQFSRSLVFPTLPSLRAIEILDVFMKAPRLGEHPNLDVCRVYADFETTRDKHRYTDEPSAKTWPVYKGESFDLWTPDTGTYFAYANGKDIAEAAHERRLRAPRGTPYSLTSRAWRADPSTHPSLHPRIAFRDVTNRTNQRTLIVTVVPPNVVTTQSAPWILWKNPEHPAWQEAFLIGVLSSIPCDWWVRRFVEGHADEEAFHCLRVPKAEANRGIVARVVRLAGRLAAIDDRFVDWAAQVEVDCGPLVQSEKDNLIEELDGAVALLYGLSEEQLVHIFETFHEGWNVRERMERTLKHYRRIRR